MRSPVLKLNPDRLQTFKWAGLFVLGGLGLAFPGNHQSWLWTLPLLVVLVAFVNTPITLNWGLGKLGVILFSVAQVAFFLDAPVVGHLLNLLAYGLWGVQLFRQDEKWRSGMALSVYLPMLLGVLVTLTLLPEVHWTALYPVLDLVLLGLALPSIQSFIEGRTSLGRSIWIVALLGLLITHLTETFMVQPDRTIPDGLLIYTLICAALASGVRLEEARHRDSLTPITASFFVLLVVQQLVQQQEVPQPLSILLFYGVFLGIGALVLALRNHQKLAQRQFLSFNNALLSMLEQRNQQQNFQLEELSESLLHNIQHIVPELVGLRFDTEEPVLMGQSTTVQREEKVYLEGRPSCRVTFYFSEVPAQQHALEASVQAAKYVIQYAARQHAMQAQLNVDPLTGASNQRAVPAIVNRYESLSSRQQLPVTVCLLDLDHFRKINEKQGHEVGDRALKLIATLIRKQLRGEDDMVRWGNDEFMVFLYNCTPEQAQGILNRVRQKMRLFSQDRLGFAVGFSVGVAGGTVQLQGDLNKWMLSADLLLLEAKARGRNQTLSGT